MRTCRYVEIHSSNLSALGGFGGTITAGFVKCERHPGLNIGPSESNRSWEESLALPACSRVPKPSGAVLVDGSQDASAIRTKYRVASLAS
jgi:hypothetical protein